MSRSGGSKDGDGGGDRERDDRPKKKKDRAKSIVYGGPPTRRGQAAVVTRDVSVTLGDAAGTHDNNAPVTLRPGTYVEVTIPRNLPGTSMCEVFSGHDAGQYAHIPNEALAVQPKIAETSETKDVRKHAVYAEYRGPLWRGKPKPADVNQGTLNDCRLMAAELALAQDAPGAIMDAFQDDRPNQTSYAVRLFRDQGKRMEPVTVTVDTRLPSLDEANDWETPEGGVSEPEDLSPIYAGYGEAKYDASPASTKVPLWPMLLEKAVAGLDKGDGYDSLNSGGASTEALATFLGRDQGRVHGWVDADQAMTTLRAAEAKNEAVICGTKNPKDHEQTPKMLKYNVHPWHAYVLDDIQGDKLKFRNPWGTEQPRLVDANAFSYMFANIQTVPLDDVKTVKEAKQDDKKKRDD
ncbi:MAG TPA: C2 family cysteine protease [Kofleriaceae bacterium]